MLNKEREGERNHNIVQTAVVGFTPKRELSSTSFRHPPSTKARRQGIQSVDDSHELYIYVSYHPFAILQDCPLSQIRFSNSLTTDRSPSHMEHRAGLLINSRNPPRNKNSLSLHRSISPHRLWTRRKCLLLHLSLPG